MPRNILIVDDAATNRIILKSILSSEYDILEADNGKEALSIMHRNYKMLSAVVLDLVMPVMGGYEVLSRMGENAMLMQIPVLVVTANDDENARIKALSLGANDFNNPEVIRHCLLNNINLRENASIINAFQRDKMTGLYSRDAFFEKAGEIIKAAEANSYIMACCDIDNFKLINDQYGAPEGDRILKYTAVRMKNGLAHAGGISGRISGDNFAGIFPNTPEACGYMSRIRDEDFIPEDFRSVISISAGRYVINDLTLSVSAMYDRSYIAKQSIKGTLLTAMTSLISRKKKKKK